MELQVHGYELTLRLAEADQIEIAPIDQRTRNHAGMERLQATEHPALARKESIIRKRMKIHCRRNVADICVGGQSELRKDDAF